MKGSDYWDVARRHCWVDALSDAIFTRPRSVAQPVPSCWAQARLAPAAHSYSIAVSIPMTTNIASPSYLGDGGIGRYLFSELSWGGKALPWRPNVPRTERNTGREQLQPRIYMSMIHAHTITPAPWPATTHTDLNPWAAIH